jgi:hypothetical protein
MPDNIRIVVPLLPQLSGSFGADSPKSPFPQTVTASPFWVKINGFF